MSIVRSLDLDAKTMQVEVIIGVQRPNKIDTTAVRATLPRGEATVNVVIGGLDVPEEGRHDMAVIASAAMVRLDLP